MALVSLKAFLDLAIDEFLGHPLAPLAKQDDWPAFALGKLINGVLTKTKPCTRLRDRLD